MEEKEDSLTDSLNTEKANLRQRTFLNKQIITTNNSNSIQNNGNLTQRAFSNKNNNIQVKNSRIKKNKISIHIPIRFLYYLTVVKNKIFNAYTIWFALCCVIDSYIMIGILDFEAESVLDIILFLLVIIIAARTSTVKLYEYIEFRTGYILKYLIAILKGILWNFWMFAFFLIVACLIYAGSEFHSWLFG